MKNTSALLAALLFAGHLFLINGQVIISTKDCGITKGCFRSPADCTQATCQYLVTYRTFFSTDNVLFEVSGNVIVGQTPYMTMGIGSNASMDQVYTIGCYFNGSTANVQDGITPPLPARGHQFGVPANIGVTGIAASYDSSNAKMSCRFFRARDPGANKIAKDLRGNVTYYLFAASGAACKLGVGYGYHAETKWFTASKVSFSQYNATSEAAKSERRHIDHNLL